MIHDFAYGDLGFDGYQPPSFLSVKGAKERRRASSRRCRKGYNMAGWRVGFAAGNREMLRALKAIKGYYDYGIFQAVQIAAIVALRHGEAAGWPRSPSIRRRRDVLVRRPEAHRLGRRDAPRRACSSGRRCPSPGGRRWARSTSP